MVFVGTLDCRPEKTLRIDIIMHMCLKKEDKKKIVQEITLIVLLTQQPCHAMSTARIRNPIAEKGKRICLYGPQIILLAWLHNAHSSSGNRAMQDMSCCHGNHLGSSSPGKLCHYPPLWIGAKWERERLQSTACSCILQTPSQFAQFLSSIQTFLFLLSICWRVQFSQ